MVSVLSDEYMAKLSEFVAKVKDLCQFIEAHPEFDFFDFVPKCLPQNSYEG